MYTLTVLETCVKNCDERFTTLVCHKEFVADMIRLISVKYDAPQIVQERVLALVQVFLLKLFLTNKIFKSHGLMLFVTILHFLVLLKCMMS